MKESTGTQEYCLQSSHGTTTKKHEIFYGSHWFHNFTRDCFWRHIRPSQKQCQFQHGWETSVQYNRKTLIKTLILLNPQHCVTAVHCCQLLYSLALVRMIHSSWSLHTHPHTHTKLCPNSQTHTLKYTHTRTPKKATHTHSQTYTHSHALLCFHRGEAGPVEAEPGAGFSPHTARKLTSGVGGAATKR